MPTVRDAFEDYLAAGPARKDSTVAVYRSTVHKDLGDWLDRPLDTIGHRDVEQRFRRLSENAGWVQVNNAMKMLRALYRRQCFDHEGLHNPVDQWRVAGGRPYRPKRRTIQPPAEVLPRWHRGIEIAVRNPVARDALRFGLYTGMRRAEVFGLAWARVDRAAMVFRIEDTKTGAPLATSRRPATRGHSRTPPGRTRPRSRGEPGLGVPVRNQQVRPSHRHAAKNFPTLWLVY